jgi:hypothetical protein
VTLGHRLRAQLVTLLVLQVITSLAAIAVLERMSPAIGHILADNEVSVEAVEVMLATLHDPTPTERTRARFFEALRAAEDNVTEAEETALLETIRRDVSSVLAGDAAARLRVATELEALGRVNRAAMHRADADAKRLGLAGQWAAALLALLGIVGSVAVLRNARRTLLAPLFEVYRVLEARRVGDRRARCASSLGGELGIIADGVNGLLDAVDAKPAAGERASETVLGVALCALLDADGSARAILDQHGKVVAASRSALDALARTPGELGKPGAWSDAVVKHEALGKTGLSVVELRAV